MTDLPHALELAAQPPTHDRWAAIIDAALDATPEQVAILDDALSHWPDPLRRVTPTWSSAISRGEEVSSPAFTLCRHLDVLAPLHGLDTTALARSSALRHLTALSISNAKLDDDALASLLASPHLQHLAHLHLRSNRLGDEAATTLASTALPALRHLDLWSNALGPAAATALTTAPWLPRLHELNLGYNPLGTNGVAALVGDGSPRELQYLGIDATRAGDDGLDALANPTAFDRLRTLHARQASVGDRGASALRRLTGLQRLALGGNPTIGDATPDALRHLPQLESLDLAGTSVTDEGARLLATADLPHLRKLTLTRTQLTIDGVRQLLESPHLPALAELAAERIAWTPADAATLAALPWHHPLEDLFLTRDTLGDDGCAIVAASPRFPAPMRSRCLMHLSVPGLKALARTLGIKGLSKLNGGALRLHLLGHLGLKG